MVPEVGISAELLPRHVVALDAIRQLGARFGPGRWVLVGGMMVMILGRQHRTTQRDDAPSMLGCTDTQATFLF